MSDNPSSPLLNHADGESSKPHRPESQHSQHSERSHKSRRSKAFSKSVHTDESTPLLSRDVEIADDSDDRPTSPAEQASPVASSPQSIQNGGSKNKRRNWSKIIALVILFLLTTTVLLLGFAAPAVVKEYAKDAIVFEPTDLSIDSFTSSGLRVRIQGDFSLDASRVRKKSTRDLGRLGTWILKAVNSKPSEIRVSMPEYGNILLGVAEVPSIAVDIRNGHTTHIDFLSDLVPGDVDGIRQILNDWLDGRLGQIRVQGVIEIRLESGILSLGKATISKSLVLQGERSLIIIFFFFCLDPSLC